MYYYTYCIVFLKGKLKDKKYFGRRESKKKPQDDIKYIGSGVIPRSYFKKYEPNETTYKKIILKEYDSLEELIKGEQELLDEHVGKDYCVNFNSNSIGGGCNKDRISVYKGNKAHYIYTELLDEYIENGYVIGRMKGQIVWNKNKHGIYSDEILDNLSNKVKELWKNEDYRNKQIERLKGNKYALGHKLSEETKEKISNKIKEWYNTHEHPFLGKHHSEETKEKISKSKKGQSNWLLGKQMPEWCKENLRKKLIGTKLMTNGMINKYIKIEDIPEYEKKGWQLGKYQKLKEG